MKPHAMITGASSGIGAALGQELARRGFPVGLIARRENELAEVCDRIEASGGRAAWASADVSDREALRQAIGELEEKLGPCELLVANAGFADRAGGHKLDVQRVRASFDVNFFGALNAVEAVLPGMIERKQGQLVAVSSLAGWRGLPRTGAYSASKAALSTFWEALRVDLQDRGIRCTTVHPGFIDTPPNAAIKNSLPFLMPVDEAARKMADGILASRRQVNFPWQTTLLTRVLRGLPDWSYDWGLKLFGGGGSRGQQRQ